MKKYRIKNTTILHDGVSRGEGEFIELTDEQAKKLADYVDIVPETKSETTKQLTKTSASKQTKTSSKSKNTKTDEKVAEAPIEEAQVIADNTEGGINGAEIV